MFNFYQSHKLMTENINDFVRADYAYGSVIKGKQIYRSSLISK